MRETISVQDAVQPNKYTPPPSGFGGFTGQATCDKQSETCATPHEQTVADTLLGMRNEHQRQADRYQEAFNAASWHVLKMPLSEFRRLNRLL